MKAKNKKGAEMTIGTIIIIILALVVLVILVYGFSTGWSNLWDKIINFGGGKANVQTVVQSCQLACTTSSTYDWCTKTRTVIFNADKADIEKKEVWTCEKLQTDKGGDVGLDDCGIQCAPINTGICSGDPINPLTACTTMDNKGKINCDTLIGCKWEDNAIANDDANFGWCKTDTSIKCAIANGDEVKCNALGCTWTA